MQESSLNPSFHPTKYNPLQINMKFTLVLLAVAACACAVYAESEPKQPENLVVRIDVDEFLTELRAKFTDESFLKGHLGDFNAPRPAAPGQEGTVQQGWANFIPWSQVLDLVVDVVKKVAKA